MYKAFFKIQFSCIGIKIYKLIIMTTTFSLEYFSIKTRNALNRTCPQKKKWKRRSARKWDKRYMKN